MISYLHILDFIIIIIIPVSGAKNISETNDEHYFLEPHFSVFIRLIKNYITLSIVRAPTWFLILFFTNTPRMWRPVAASRFFPQRKPGKVQIERTTRNTPAPRFISCGSNKCPFLRPSHRIKALDHGSNGSLKASDNSLCLCVSVCEGERERERRQLNWTNTERKAIMSENDRERGREPAASASFFHLRLIWSARRVSFFFHLQLVVIDYIPHVQLWFPRHVPASRRSRATELSISQRWRVIRNSRLLYNCFHSCFVWKLLPPRYFLFSSQFRSLAL